MTPEEMTNKQLVSWLIKRSKHVSVCRRTNRDKKAQEHEGTVCKLRHELLKRLGDDNI